MVPNLLRNCEMNAVKLLCRTSNADRLPESKPRRETEPLSMRGIRRWTHTALESTPTITLEVARIATQKPTDHHARIDATTRSNAATIAATAIATWV